MPYSIYASLNLGPLKQTGVIIQLADQSDAYPEGVVEDVLVKVNELIFPADFYILHMEDSASLDSSPILLGRPFLKTSKTKIDVDKGTFTMEFDGELTRFDIFKNPIENHALSSANIENFVLQVPPDEKKKKSKLNGGRNLMIEKNVDASGRRR